MLQFKIQPPSPRPLTHRDSRGSQPEKLAAAHTRFLIAAADRKVGTALSFMLEARGYVEIRTARSAARTEFVLGDFQPDIVFLDIDLAARLQYIGSMHKSRLIALADEPPRDGMHPAFERLLVKPVPQHALDEILRGPVADPRRPRH